MGNQQTGGDVSTMAPPGGGPPPPFSYGNDDRSLPLSSDILSGKPCIPTTVITPPGDDDIIVNGYDIDSGKTGYKSYRRGSVAIGELQHLQKAHMPAIVPANPCPKRINQLLGAPMPSRARRGSMDPSSLLPTKRGSADHSPSPLSSRTGSRSRLLQSLLSKSGKGSFDRSSDKLDKLDKKDSENVTSPPLNARDRRRGSLATAKILLQASLQVAALHKSEPSKSVSNRELETLEEGSGRYFQNILLS